MTSEKEKILLVEDDVSQAKLMGLAIKRSGLGCDIQFATNGDEALVMLSEESYGAILLDYNLPLKDGLTVLKRLRQDRVPTPVIMVTGEGSEEVAVEAMKRGAYDYIIKRPGYLELLPRVVAKAVERNRLATELKRTELKYRALVEMASDAIFVEDPDSGRLIEVNARAEQLTGRSREELLTMKGVALYVSEDQPSVTKLCRQSLTDGAGVREALRILRKDGDQLWVDVSASAVDLGDRKVVQNIVRDVTERRKLEQQILLTNRRLESAFDGIADMISVVDSEKNLIIVNKRFAEQCGKTPGELVGQKCYQTFFKSSGPCANCPVALTFKTEKAHFEEREYAEGIYHVWSYPMLGLDGRPEFVVEYVKDVTEQRRMEQHLIQSEKLATVGLLSSGIAHELRNPLSVIESARYYLEESLQHTNADVVGKLEMIKRNIRRASAIINSLLEFSRRSDRDREVVNVAKVIDNTLALLEKELSSRHIQLVRSGHNNQVGPDSMVAFNVDSLKQVFLNIIINAIHAMPNGGRLTINIRTVDEEGLVEVDFEDTGYGISSKDLPHIFSPFYTTKEVGEGTGLGLYISHSMVKRDGGDIFVKSEEGKGTVFTVRMPMAPAFEGTEALDS